MDKIINCNSLSYDSDKLCDSRDSADSAVVKALASHQRDPGSIPTAGVMGLSSLLSVVPAPSFSQGCHSVFLPP